ncbi:MAG: hypothetical protein ACLVJN_08645 [Streptococcus parasanguinis]
MSGGHTELVYVSEAGDYKIVGETSDDAVGEAYDKVGRVMGLTYPAGREIDQLAHQGSDIYDFPRAMIKEDNLEFSFSGLKSAFINLHHNAEQKGESPSNADLSASFQADCTRHSHGQDQEGLRKISGQDLGRLLVGSQLTKVFVNAWLLRSQMLRSSFRLCASAGIMQG